MKLDTTLVNGLAKRRASWRTALLLAGTFFLGVPSNAQVVFNETFTGGASTAGFTITQTAGACGWSYANPGARSITGASFDSDFAIFDSDHCGSGGGTATGQLLSPVFDASAASNFILTFSQSYQAYSNSTATVAVWNGTTWNTIYTLTTTSSGYPNPAIPVSLDVTTAANGSTAAQIRFQYTGNWAYWWALDNIVLTGFNCTPPSGLAVSGITLNGGTIGWTDNGSAGYSWAVTTGAVPNGSNEISEGDGTITAITGLNSSTTYTAWVRADCGDGSFSAWSSGVNFATLCGVVNLPYSENFNSVTTPALPLCMSTQTVSGNTWKTVNAPSGMTGKSGDISYTSSGSPAMDSWLFTPGLAL